MLRNVGDRREAGSRRRWRWRGGQGRDAAEDRYLQLYQAEVAANEYLRLTQQMKDELVSTVTHELRTPLTCILGFAHTLHEHADVLPPEARQEFVERIIAQSERLHRLVESFLMASRVVEPEFGATADVRTELQNAVRDLVDVHGATVETAVAPGELRARIAPAALYQVVFNLAENGAKFSEPGGRPLVTAWRDGDDAVLEVSNRGGGIPLEQQVRIFEPFVQLDASTTRETRGVGLGLAIVRRLVEGHRGQVGVRSTSGETVFWVRLPAAAEPASPPAADAANRTGGRYAASDGTPARAPS